MGIFNEARFLLLYIYADSVEYRCGVRPVAPIEGERENERIREGDSNTYKASRLCAHPFPIRGQKEETKLPEVAARVAYKVAKHPKKIYENI